MTAPQAGGDAEVLLRIAVAAAAEAGRLLASWRGDERPEVVQTKSSPTDIVTEMDRRSEALITNRIRAYRPGDTVAREPVDVRVKPHLRPQQPIVKARVTKTSEKPARLAVRAGGGH